jgi:hypothetical protein
MAEIKVNMDSLKPTREWVRHKVLEGENVYRILPPFGENHNGYPYKKWYLIWGLKDPQRGTVKPYQSSLPTEKACPVVEFVTELKTLADERAIAITEQLKAKGVVDQPTVDKYIKAANKELNLLISDLRPKSIFLYNASNQSGVVGILEVKATAQAELKTLMNNYISVYNQDPTSLNSAPDDSGVWFKFIRTGKGFSTKYKVEKKQMTQKDANGQISFVDDRSPLAENVTKNYEEQAYDIHNLYTTNTYDELRAILIANLGDIINRCPDAKSVAVKLGLLNAVDAPVSVQVAQNNTNVADRTPSDSVSPTPTAAAKTVTLNLGQDDDDDTPDLSSDNLTGLSVASQASQTPVVATTTIDDNDILAHAESLLKD